MENNLPKGWFACKLGDIIKIQNGYAFPSKDFRKDKGVPLIKQSQLSGDKVNIDKCVYLDEKYLSQKKEFIIKKGDVLIGMSGSIGKLCTYDLEIPALQNQRTGKVLLKSNELNDRFIWYYLSTIEKQLLEKGKGLGVANVSADDIGSLPLLLPPFAEQRRIVQKLDGLMERVNKSKVRLDKIPAILKNFRQSVLAAAVSGELTSNWRKLNGINQSWVETELGKLLNKGEIFDGPFGSNLKTSDYSDKGVRVIRLENIEHLSFIGEKETFISEEKYKSLQKHTVNENDIMFSSFIADEIRVCMLPRLNTAAIAKADCFCIRPSSNKINKKYLLFVLASGRSYEQLVLNVHGATRPRVNTTQLKELMIPLPLIEEQVQIVRRIEELFHFADIVETRYLKAKEWFDKIPQAILAKAFRGGLVEQDKNDEPAHVLLEKIKAEKVQLISGKLQSSKKNTLKSSV